MLLTAFLWKAGLPLLNVSIDRLSDTHWAALQGFTSTASTVRHTSLALHCPSEPICACTWMRTCIYSYVWATRMPDFDTCSCESCLTCVRLHLFYYFLSWQTTEQKGHRNKNVSQSQTFSVCVSVCMFVRVCVCWSRQCLRMWDACQIQGETQVLNRQWFVFSSLFFIFFPPSEV